jgi:hypothetical protein
VVFAPFLGRAGGQVSHEWQDYQGCGSGNIGHSRHRRSPCERLRFTPTSFAGRRQWLIFRGAGVIADCCLADAISDAGNAMGWNTPRGM